MDDQARELIDQLREEIRQLQARIGQLEQENRHLRQQVDALGRENQQLRDRLEAAEQAAARQAAPFRREPRNKIPPDQQKRPGRKKGHPGCCRPTPPVIDETVEVPLESCPRCGRELVGRPRRCEQIIEEIVPARPHVTRVITYQGECPVCGPVQSRHRLQTSHGQGAAKVQLGPRALAIATCLNKQHGLSMGKTCRVLKDLTGLSFSRGGLSHALMRVAGKVQGCYRQLVDRVRASPAVFADETSWWVGGPGWWLWVFTTAAETVYHVDRSRGSKVVRKILGESFAGMLVSDCLSSYDPPDCRKHKCIAHHLRAISKAKKLPGMTDGRYLRQWRLFFTSVLAVYKLRAQVPIEQFLVLRGRLEAWRDRLLKTVCGLSGDVRVRNRLLKRREHLLGCLYEPAAEPTNNRAERALRPAVIARKVSCGNRTDRGRTCWQILASLAATCQQKSINFVDDLAPRLPLAAAPG